MVDLNNISLKKISGKNRAIINEIVIFPNVVLTNSSNSSEFLELPFLPFSE